ncbi:MAG: hypothetical protein GC206_00535 [Alphaproteobacteria bacterium]|nr:hypothetical protein [Alphaproteobacteria bacterium]
MENVRPYFAYGSNLHAADWRAWCARRGYDPDTIRPLARAFLPDHRLVFDYRSHTRNGGVCNLAPARGAYVEGWLFDVSEAGWAALDEKESLGVAYERVDLIGLTEAGEEIAVTTYRVPEMRLHGHTPPTPEYLDIVLSARRALGMNTAEIESAVNEETAPAPNLFVYGTLLEGEANHHRIARHCNRCADAAVRGTLHDLGAYPGMTLAPAHDVLGEVVALDAAGAGLAAADLLESFHGFGDARNLYRRTLVPIGGAWTWTYVLTGPFEAPVIASGCWRTHVRSR